MSMMSALRSLADTQKAMDEGLLIAYSVEKLIEFGVGG